MAFLAFAPERPRTPPNGCEWQRVATSRSESLRIVTSGYGS
nr:MAG TPA: hypothetical protein [Caudoviricetes sp.]